MAAVPYEILNSLEWMIDGDAYPSGFSENEDEWADGRSTASSSNHASQTEPNHQTSVQQAQSNLHPQSSISTVDDVGWTAVTKGSKRKPIEHSKTSEPKIELPVRPSPSTNAARSLSKSKVTPVVKKQIPRHQIAAKKPILGHTLHFPRDNAAKAAYRNRRPANGRYILHKEVGEIEPNQPKLYNMLEGLGVRFKTFLRPPQGPAEREIFIWGEQHNVDRTIRNIKEWERSVEAGPVPINAKTKGTFATVKSAATQTYQKGIKRLDREAAFKIYQQVPDPDKQYPFQGWVLWDIEETSPNDVFGVSLEAFDPIRRQNKCHIIYEESIETLRVLADKKDHIDQAVQRIRVAIESLRVQSSRDVTKYLVDMTLSSSVVYEDVKLISGQPGHQGGSGPVIPFSHGNSMKTPQRLEWIEECKKIEKQNQQQIEQILKAALPFLQYQAGQILIRVRFGTFGLTKFPVGEDKTSLPLRSFLERMGTSGVKGELTRDLRIRQDWDDIMNFFKTSHLFEGMDSASGADHIQARFVINRVDKPAVRYVRDVRKSITDTYDLEVGRWMRDDGKDSRAPLQIYMTQLDGKTSWNLQVSTHPQLHESYVDPKMAFFADSLVFDCKDIKNVHRTGRKQFSFRPNAHILKPSIFEQKTSCYYRLNDAPQWAVEVSRFDRYRPSSDFPVTTNWSASMLNLDWDSTLSSNDRLKIGELAQWEPKLETFFGSSDLEDETRNQSAISGFLETIRSVTSFFDDMRKM